MILHDACRDGAISEGGEVRAPMATCVIGGLITSTALTLVVVPVVYTFMDGLGRSRLVKFLQRIAFGKQAQVHTPEPATSGSTAE